MNYRIAVEFVMTSALSVASAITAVQTPAGNPGDRVFTPFATTLGSAQSEAADRKATAFVHAKIDEHWIETADGWTTKFQRKNAVGDVLPGEPALLYRQVREFAFTLEPRVVTEEDKRAGVDYIADVKFDKTNERFYRRIETDEGPKGWSAWQDAALSSLITVERRNGKWVLNADDLLKGVRPNSSSVPTGD